MRVLVVRQWHATVWQQPPYPRHMPEAGHEKQFLKLADVLESMPEVAAYAKNQGLNFKIPYTRSRVSLATTSPTS